MITVEGNPSWFDGHGHVYAYLCRQDYRGMCVVVGARLHTLGQSVEEDERERRKSIWPSKRRKHDVLNGCCLHAMYGSTRPLRGWYYSAIA